MLHIQCTFTALNLSQNLGARHGSLAHPHLPVSEKREVHCVEQALHQVLLTAPAPVPPAPRIIHLEAWVLVTTANLFLSHYP